MNPKNRPGTTSNHSDVSGDALAAGKPATNRPQQCSTTQRRLARILHTQIAILL